MGALYLQGVTENGVHSRFWREVCSHFLWQHEDKSGESKKLVNFQQFDGVISACSAFVSRLVKSKSAELLVDLHWHKQAGGGGIGLESCKPTFQHILPNDSAEKILQISCQADPFLILLDLHKTPGQIHVVTRATGLVVHPEV